MFLKFHMWDIYPNVGTNDVLLRYLATFFRVNAKHLKSKNRASLKRRHDLHLDISMVGCCKVGWFIFCVTM
jgi:hypothetical protein